MHIAEQLARTAPLKEGDKVAVFAPASHPAKDQTELIDRGAEILAGWGLRVELQSDGFWRKHFYLAGQDEYRAKNFEAFYCDDSIKALFSIRGGYGCNRMVPLLDHGKIARHRKPVIGFSDVTFLLNYLEKVAKVQSFHGPGIGTNQFVKYEENQESLRKFLFDDSHRPTMGIRELREGAVEAPLTGGCLSLVVTSLGTPWEIDTRGKIIFLEDVNEKPYRLDRMITHLRNAGKFDEAAGVVFGDLESCEGESESLVDILADLFSTDIFPVALDSPCGHGKRNLTLPFGRKARIDTAAGEFQVL